ncbi:MAG: branched-chain amino acid ABC transporter permease [Fimbriimonadaceae bacterium]|nr:branched-chain amino acid ABC transporter permease [Fimbriimonadaceae bacterium]
MDFGHLMAGLDFSTLPQQLVNGVLLGAIYALIALGYTMVYGVLRLINFAHGEVFMLGAYTALFTSWIFGFKGGAEMPEASLLKLGAMLLISMFVCGTIGVIIERLAYRPMRNQPRISVLITAIGVSLFLQYGGALFLPNSPPPSINEKVMPESLRGAAEINLTPPDAKLKADWEQKTAAAKVANDAYEAVHQTLKPGDPEPPELKPLRDQRNTTDREAQNAQRLLDNSGVRIRIPKGQFLMLGTTVALMVLLTLLVMGTPAGRAMRAVAHDFDSASLMGINVGQTITFTFLIGSMLAGAGAMMNATFIGTPLTTFYGFQPGVKAFVAAVLGGIGNIPGAVLGGLLMGIAETTVVWMGYSSHRDAVAFVILIVVLLFRPGGLLGSSKVEKV